ncbi:MAG: Fur family transcriptional regulator [Actinomycetota bacterium]|nr:Fur family transcriptional regulator [Actinomycetota bacterium]
MAAPIAKPRSTASCDQASISEALMRVGLRPTRARCGILAHLLGSDVHPNAEEITAGLRSDGIAVGVATVYQNLNKLADAGLVHRLAGPDGRTRFDADLSDHDHIVCDSCVKVRDFDLAPASRHALHRAAAGDAATGSWLISRTTIELHGLCPECRAH